MKTTSKRKNQETGVKFITIPQFKFFWDNSKKGKDNKQQITSAQVLINGKLTVFVFCSLVSAFINLVFISNLTKSDYNIGTIIAIPAAVLLGLLSIGLDIGKFLLAIQVNTLSELIRKLSRFPWVRRVKRAARWWRIVYVTFILLSVITSVSLSTISIGAGISRNANLIAQIDEYILTGEQYTSLNEAAKKTTFANTINQATDTSEDDAIRFAKSKMQEIRSAIEDYKSERDEFESQFTGKKIDWSSIWKNEVAENYWNKKNRQINILLQNAGYGSVSGTQIKNLNLSKVEETIKINYLASSKTANRDKAMSKLAQLTDDTNDEVRGWLDTLNALNLINPKTGEILEFSTDENKAAIVLAKSALTLLKALRVDVENDSGDIGSSSKLFMQLGSAWESRKIGDKDLQAALNVKTKGSFGATEVMMMGMLLFLSLLCELLINLFAPKTNISRKMLSQFSEYFDANFDVNDFMLEIYLDQLNFGILDKSTFELRSKRAVELTEITKASLYEKYSFENQKLLQEEKDKIKIEKSQQQEIDRIKKQYEEQIGDLKRKVEEKQIIETKEVQQPPTPLVQEIPEYSSAVDTAISEIDRLLNED